MGDVTTVLTASLLSIVLVPVGMAVMLVGLPFALVGGVLPGHHPGLFAPYRVGGVIVLVPAIHVRRSG